MGYHGEIELAQSSSFGELVLAHYASYESLGRHRHVTPYVSVCLEGGYSEEFEDGCDELTRGDILIHPANEVHADTWSGRGATLLALELTLPVQKLFGLAHAYRSRVRARCPEEALRQLGPLLSRLPAGDAGLPLLAAAELLLPSLSSAAAQPELGEGRLRVARLLVERHPERSWRLGELASAAGCHPTYFAGRFRKVYGCPPGEYVRRIRVRAALRLVIDHDISLTDAAHVCGFYDSAHMTHTFRRVLGVPPSAFKGSRLTH